MIGSAPETARLLVVSRDSAVIRQFWALGESNSLQLESATDVWEAMKRVQSGAAPDLLLLDLPRGDGDGLHILRWLRRIRPALAIVLIGDPDDVDKQQEATRLGARDYLFRPLDDRRLELVLRQHLPLAFDAIETDITSEDVELISDDAFFIGISPIMRKLRAQAALLAKTNLPVLILGEGGSGKETTARLIHKLSLHSGCEFAKVNCAALPSDLLERALFGYDPDDAGSPGGAKSGKLELCAKGTILLHEITELPMSMQANLLQVLQNKRFTKPGTSTSIEVDVRILVTSTANMEHALSEKRFCEDLYYRLSAYTIHVPPLRERKEELPILSRHFVRQLAEHYGLAPRDFSPAIVEACQAYSWPGNLRELKNFVKCYLMAGERELTLKTSCSDLDEKPQSSVLTPPARSRLLEPSIVPFRAIAGSDSLRSLVQSVKSEAEKKAIAAALEKTGGNRKAAARLLKISYRTLLYKIEQYRMRSASDSSLLSERNLLRNEGMEFRGNGRSIERNGG